MRRYIVVAGAIGVTAMLVAGCAAGGGDAASQSAEPSSSSDEPIKIGIVYGITGAFASFVADFMTGAEAAADTINAKGGVNGRPVEIEITDDKSDPTLAVTLVTEMIDSGNVPDAIVPGGTSAEALALLPLISGTDLFSVSSATNEATNDPDAYPYHFGTSPKLVDLTTPVAADMGENDVKTVGVLLPSNATGDAKLAALQEGLDEEGIEIVQIERPDEAALNFDVEMERIKNANPDAIFFDFNPYDASARALQSRAAVGAIDIPIYGGSAAVGAPFKELLDEDALANCFLPTFDYTVKSDDMAEDLQPLYEAAADADASVGTAAYGWDVVQLVALAFERADDTSGAALAEAVLSEDIPADLLALFRSGTTYTEDDHFPTLDVDDMTIVKCDTPQEDGGLWVVD